MSCYEFHENPAKSFTAVFFIKSKDYRYPIKAITNVTQSSQQPNTYHFVAFQFVFIGNRQRTENVHVSGGLIFQECWN